MFFEMSGTSHSVKQNRTPEDLNPQSCSVQHHAFTYGVTCTRTHGTVLFPCLVVGAVNVASDVKQNLPF
jgi:hypothetical protein